MPLTNAHTHLELSDLAWLCPKEPIPFPQWLASLIKELPNRPGAQIIQGIKQGIAQLEACGTTHVGDISATGLSIEPLRQSSLQGIVYLEVLGNHPDEALERLDRAQEQIMADRRAGPHKISLGLSVHAPYSCHPELFRQAAKWCREEKIPLAIHAAESPMECEKLTSRPIPYLDSLGVLEARPLLIHGVQVNEAEVRLIKERGCSVAHCPRSNERLRCGRMPLETYLKFGVPVYLGTDSLASCPDLDVHNEATFAKGWHEGRVATKTIEGLLRKAY